MLRAARFAAQLNFDIEKTAITAMNAHRKRLSIVSKERIQEEFLKLLGTPKPSIGIGYVYATKVLDEFLPEVRELSGVEEVKGYKHKDNLSHTLAVVDNVAELSPKPLLRLAGLLHDIAKPQTKKLIPGRGWTFDMHEHLGRKMAKGICNRLKMSKDDTYYVTELVRWHLQPIALMDEGVTDSAVRRLIINLQERLDDLLLLCKADITTGNQKKKAKRLKNYDNIEKRIAAVEEIDVLRAFQSPVRGEEIMEECGLKPGPTIGKIKEDIEEAILDGRVENEYDAAKAYFDNIKDAYIAKAGDWEKKG
jgi:tRNA nucleotidyltransferase (CCA-adding enzyme)